MFVGENPAMKEDEEGVPFVGRAGKLFNYFVEINPGFPAFFVTNTVLCKPRGRGKPKAHHWKACRPRLLEQIRIIDPVIIVAMGATAGHALVGKEGSVVRKARKGIYWIEVPGHSGTYVKPVAVTYHPSGIQQTGQTGPSSYLEASVKDLRDVKRVAEMWMYYARPKGV